MEPHRSKSIFRDSLWRASLTAVGITVLVAATVLKGPAVNPATSSGQEWQATRHQIERLQDEEKRILASLLEASSALARQEKEVRRLQVQGEEARRNLEQAREQYRSAEQRYRTGRDRAGRQLRLLQQAGPASYLEILLGATSWGDLVERWRLMTDLTQGTLILLRDLVRERDRCREQLAVVEQAEQLLEGRLEEARSQEEALRQKVAAREELLASLGGRRSYFERTLQQMEALVAKETRPLLEKLSTVMAGTDLAGSTGKGPISLQLTAEGWQVGVSQAALEAALAGKEESGTQPHLFCVELEEGKVVLSAPVHDLRLEGQFVPAREGTATAFQVQSAQVAGVELGSEAMTALCQGLGLSIDLRPLLPPGLRVHKITAVPGWLQVTVASAGAGD